MKQIPFLKFKEREETKGIMVFCTEDDMPVEKYARIMMRKGWFSVGYNYLIHSDGTIEEGLSPLVISNTPDITSISLLSISTVFWT